MATESEERRGKRIEAHRELVRLAIAWEGAQAEAGMALVADDRVRCIALARIEARAAADLAVAVRELVKAREESK